MTANIGTWIARGQELACFPDDGSAAQYFLSFQNSDIAAVKWELERIFSGPHRMPAVNWLAFSSYFGSVESSLEDGPKSFVEDLQPSDFEIEAWGGGKMYVSSLYGASSSQGWDELLVDLAGAFIFSTPDSKQGLAATLASAVKSAAGARPVSMSGLARAATAAQFLGIACPGSQELVAIVPDYVQIGNLLPGLKTRAGKLIDLWASTLGALAANAPPYPLTLYGIRSAGDIPAVEAQLAAAMGPSNRNLLTFLSCLDYT